MENMIRYTKILILLLCLWTLIAPFVSGSLNGYAVDPVTPDMDTGTRLETVPVDFWDLPPGIMLLSLALSVSTVVGFPVELIVFVKMYAYLGYRRVSKTIIFNNDIRSLAYRTIQDNPGIYFNSLVRKTGIKPGTLRYHLIILRITDKISVMNTNGNTRYFENSGKFSDMEKVVLKYVRNDIDNRLLLLLLDNPDTNRKDLKEKMGISGPLVTWYMRRLHNDGMIFSRKSGKNVRYEINPEARQYLEKYLIPGRENIPIPPFEEISDPV
jgi:predicted transcriptional regulator